MTDNMDTVAEAREWIGRIADSLPKSVDPAALGVKDKAPWKLMVIREALIWRTEELGRNACDALERDDFAAAAILTRALTENAALTWMLMEILDGRSRYTPDELHKLLSRLLLGSRAWPETPQAVQILNSIDKMNKRIPGVRASYDGLSDIVHPNWRGVAGLYSANDTTSLITNFGRGLRGVDSTRGSITSALLGSLGAFEHSYNRIGDVLPDFLAELESIWPNDPEQPKSTLSEPKVDE